MSEPTPQAYEAAALAKLKATPDSWRVNEAEMPILAKELGARGHQLRSVVDAVWPIAVAATRAQVAAEIRADVHSQRANYERHPVLSDMAMHLWVTALDRAARIAEGTPNE